jgi:ABC-2 type transport system permease protein
MTRLWTILANTFIQTIRRPIFTILLLATYLALVLEVQMAANSQGLKGVSNDDNQLQVNLGLSTLMISSLVLAAFSAAGALTREIEQRTMLTVVTKPVSRPVILAGKFLGVLAAVTVGFYLCALVYLMTVRQGVLTRGADPYDYVVIPLGLGALALALAVAAFGNYLFSWSFHTAATLASTLLLSVAMVFICLFEKGWIRVPFGSSFDPQLLLVVALLWMAVAVLTALTVIASARLGQAATLGVVAGLYALSLLSASLFRGHAHDNYLALAVYRLVPNASYFFAVDQLMLKQHITGEYVALTGLYAAAYIVAALLIGIALFQTREVDAVETAAAAPTLVNIYAWAMRLGALALGLVSLAVIAGKPDTHRLLLAAALLAPALLGWLWAGLLGRGVRWALHLVILATAAQVIYALIYVFVLHSNSLEPLTRLVILSLTAIHALYVLTFRLRRATRAHFDLRGRRRAASPIQLEPAR